MEWVLILTLWVQGGAEMRFIEMYNRRDCMAAAAQWKADMMALGMSKTGYAATCIAKVSKRD